MNQEPTNSPPPIIINGDKNSINKDNNNNAWNNINTGAQIASGIGEIINTSNPFLQGLGTALNHANTGLGVANALNNAKTGWNNGSNIDGMLADSALIAQYLGPPGQAYSKTIGIGLLLKNGLDSWIFVASGGGL